MVWRLSAIFTTTLNIPTPEGTLLTVPDLVLTGVPGVPFAIPIPDRCELIGLSFTVQGVEVALAPAGFQLTNALDVTVGIQ